MIREVIFYTTETGRGPIQDFLDTLSSKQAQKAAWVIGLVEDMEVVPRQYFQKKTRKTPSQAIQLAEERRRDYFRRKRK